MGAFFHYSAARIMQLHFALCLITVRRSNRASSLTDGSAHAHRGRWGREGLMGFPARNMLSRPRRKVVTRFSREPWKACGYTKDRTHLGVQVRLYASKARVCKSICRGNTVRAIGAPHRPEKLSDVIALGRIEDASE